jgi:hypothetical protein
LQKAARLQAGRVWQGNSLVFTTPTGDPMDSTPGAGQNVKDMIVGSRWAETRATYRVASYW